MSNSLSGRSSEARTNPARQQLDDLDALVQRMLDLPVDPNADEPASEESPVERVYRNMMERPAETTTYKVHEASESSPHFIPPRNDEESVDRSYTVTEVVSAALSVTPPEPGSVREDTETKIVEGQEVADGDEEQRELDATLASGSVDEGEAWVPFRSSWQPSAQTWQPLVESWQQGRATRDPDDEPAHVPQLAPIPSGEMELVPVLSSVLPPREVIVPQPSSLHPKSEHVVGRTTTLRPHQKEPEGVSWAFWPLVAVNWSFDLLLLPLGPIGSALRTQGGRSFLGSVGLVCLVAAGAWAVVDYLGLDLLARLR